ncbi:MAG: hypothetical protein JWN78_1626 [Bacteroidota bacterium]|nr:hypothetical protein [Bacteroidota bacterium]
MRMEKHILCCWMIAFLSCILHAQIQSPQVQTFHQIGINHPYAGNDNSFSNYQNPVSQQQATQAWIYEQMRNDPAYNPSLRGANGQYQTKQMKELQSIIDEIHKDIDKHPEASRLFVQIMTISPKG